MRFIYVDEAPSADPHGNVFILRMAEGKHPLVGTSPAVLRSFCETTLVKLDRWEAEQAGRVCPLKKRSPKH